MLYIRESADPTILQGVNSESMKATLACLIDHCSNQSGAVHLNCFPAVLLYFEVRLSSDSISDFGSKFVFYVASCGKNKVLRDRPWPPKTTKTL